MTIRTFILTCLSFFTFSTTIFAQYPNVPNGSFENWAVSSGTSAEPDNWNSNKTGGGNAPSGPQTCFLETSNPYDGTRCVRIETLTYLVFIVVNGSCTTGKVEAPTTSKADGYVHTIKNDPLYSSAFNGRPDSIIGYYRYNSASSDYGKIKVVLHVGNYYDPEAATSYHPDSTVNRIASGTFFTPSSSQTTWKKFSIPMTYYDSRTPQYILISMTSSGNQNGGSSGSKMWVDGMKAFYNPTLSTGTISTINYYVTSSQSTSVSIPFTLTGTMNSGNVVTAQLSDAAGSFTSPVVLGTLATTTSGTITGTIPAGTPTGSGYRIRVISSSYPLTAANNGSNIQIYNVSNSVGPSTSQSICQNANGSNLTVTENPAGTSREWKFATISGGTYSSFSPAQTNTTYTPNFQNTGTYYVVCQSQIGGYTIRSNEVAITVNQTPQLTASAAASAICSGGSTILSVGGADTYNWTPGNLIGGSVNVSPLGTTTYTVTGTTTSACSSTASLTISVYPQLVNGSLTASPTAGVVCSGINVSALVTPGSGGAGSTADVSEIRYNSGTWNPYVSGSTLSTTGFNTVDIRTYRTSSESSCITPTPAMVSWTIASPDALNAVNITSTSADLTWNDPNGSAWNIEYGLQGFSQGSGTQISGTTSLTHNVTGLALGTDYSFYVQSNCGSSNSAWVGPYSFTTNSGNQKTLSIKVFLEGLYAGSGLMNQAQGTNGPVFGANIADHVNVELHSSTSPYGISYSFNNIDLHTNGLVTINTLPGDITGLYYIVVKHRNSIETWSASPYNFNTTGAFNYDFTTSASQAFSNNLKSATGNVYLIYGGNVTQDLAVDASDLAAVDNGATLLLSGYYPEDVNGDGTVDASDMALIDNNVTGLVSVMRP